jgi:preprotein translocase subunit YajC
MKIKIAKRLYITIMRLQRITIKKQIKLLNKLASGGHTHLSDGRSISERRAELAVELQEVNLTIAIYNTLY